MCWISPSRCWCWAPDMWSWNSCIGGSEGWAREVSPGTAVRAGAQGGGLQPRLHGRPTTAEAISPTIMLCGPEDRKQRTQRAYGSQSSSRTKSSLIHFQVPLLPR